jgi:hypothetical protein
MTDDELRRRIEALEEEIKTLPPPPEQLDANWSRLITATILQRGWMMIGGFALLLTLGALGWLNQTASGVARNAVVELTSDSQSDFINKIVQQLENSDAVKAHSRSSLDGFALAFIGETATEAPCPNGWDRVVDLEGRFLLGAGAEAGPDRIEARALEAGGQADHLISVDALPDHDHALGLEIALREGDTFGLVKDDGSFENNVPVDDLDSIGDALRTQSDPDRAPQQPLRVEPPYLAVHFCTPVVMGTQASE